MIEQQEQLILTFPTEASATTFAAFLATLLQTPNQSATPDPASDVSSGQRSRHTVLTDDRLEALFNQRQQGQTAHQRVLRAQTTLRDGVLPFSKPGEMPPPSGQPSPRQKAAAGGNVRRRGRPPRQREKADCGRPPRSHQKASAQGRASAIVFLEADSDRDGAVERHSSFSRDRQDVQRESKEVEDRSLRCFPARPDGQLGHAHHGRCLGPQGSDDDHYQP